MLRAVWSVQKMRSSPRAQQESIRLVPFKQEKFNKFWNESPTFTLLNMFVCLLNQI
jgi:hypothetical protein